MNPGAQAIDEQILDADDHHPQSVDLDFGSRRIFSRKAGRRRRLEEQVEIDVKPVPPFLLEAERGERGIDLRRRRERQVHVLGRIAPAV